MSELVSVVFVSDEVGVSHRFGPGDVVPEWAVRRIVNPKAWDVPPEFDVSVEIDDRTTVPVRKIEPEPEPVSAPRRRGRAKKVVSEAEA